MLLLLHERERRKLCVCRGYISCCRVPANQTRIDVQEWVAIYCCVQQWGKKSVEREREWLLPEIEVNILCSERMHCWTPILRPFAHFILFFFFFTKPAVLLVQLVFLIEFTDGRKMLELSSSHFAWSDFIIRKKTFMERELRYVWESLDSQDELAHASQRLNWHWVPSANGQFS